MGADTLSPYCISSVSSSVAPTTTTVPAQTTTTPLPSSTGSSSKSISTTTLKATTPTPRHTTAAASSTAAGHPSPPGATHTSTASAVPQQGGLTHPAQIAIGVVVPVAVVILVGALWFLIFRRPGRGRGHRRGGTGDTSFGFGTGSRGPTPPPAYSKAGSDRTLGGPPLSMHEQYIMEANAERGREGPAVGEGFEMADLRREGGSSAGQTVVERIGTQPGAGPGDVSPLSDDGGSRGRVSPHPGNVVDV